MELIVQVQNILINNFFKQLKFLICTTITRNNKISIHFILLKSKMYIAVYIILVIICIMYISGKHYGRVLISFL